MPALLARLPAGLASAVMLAVAHQPLAPPHHRPRLVRLIHIPPDLLHQLGRDGPLERPWLAVGIAMLLTASIALALWRGHRHRRAGTRPRHLGLRRMALGGWLTLPTLFGALPSHPTVIRFSRVESLLIGDRALDVPPARAYVYLPPGYEAKANAHRRYPVVYLLHGYPGSPIDWFRAAEVQDQMDALLRYHLVQPMLIVAPDASGGWLHDSEMLNQVGGPQVETYLTHTVVAAVDARYRTIPDRSGRAIGGVSSGGYGALNLGLHHQATYSVILSMMPYGDPGAVTQSLLGGSRKLWLANSPSHYIPAMTIHHPMMVFLAAGSKDPQLPEARLLARLLSKRAQPAVVTEVPGATHTWHGARAEIPYALAFASQHLTTTIEPLLRLASRPPAARAGRATREGDVHDPPSTPPPAAALPRIAP